MSMRAAIQPSAKNSAGIGSSHQSSRRACQRPAMLFTQATQLPPQPGRPDEAREKPGGHAGSECDQQQEDQRRLPGEPLIEAYGDQLGVLQGQEQERDEQHTADDPAQQRHQAKPPANRVAIDTAVR